MIENQASLMWNDIIKFITVIVIVHLLFYCVDDYGGFMNESILKILLYTVIAIIIYYLVITKLVNKYLFSKPNDSPNNKVISLATNPVKENFNKNNIKPILKKDRIKSRNSRNSKKVRFKEE